MNRIYPAEFIIYVYYRTFKTYLWALSLFSLTITIIVSAAAKYFYQYIIGYSNYNSFIKEAFQLSYLLFIPIFSVLLIVKYKKKFIDEDMYAELNMPNVVVQLFTVLLLLALTLLFTFLLIAWQDCKNVNLTPHYHEDFAHDFLCGSGVNIANFSTLDDLMSTPQNTSDSNPDVIIGYLAAFFSTLVVPIIFTPRAVVFGFVCFFAEREWHGAAIIILGYLLGSIGASIGGWRLEIH